MASSGIASPAASKTGGRLGGKDLINIGIFTAIYFVVVFAVACLGFVPILIAAVCGIIPLVAGIPYMLFLTRVRKFGMITILGLLTYTSTGGVEGSALYAFGTAIEPVTRFFGMGWQTFTAWLCALVLKESALGVLSGLFTGAATPNAVLVGVMTGGAAAASNIGEIMARSISAPEALAFIFAFTFNMPCAASVSATWGEVHSTKWTVITAAFYVACSLLLGCVVYHASLLFLS